LTTLRMPANKRHAKAWRRKLKATWDLLVNRRNVSEVARLYAVSRATIHRWSKEVLASDEPEAEGLRRVIKETA